MLPTLLKRTALVLLLAFGALQTAHAQSTPEGPKAQVKATVDQVLIVLRDTSLDWNTKEARVKEIVRERFDFRSMSQSVLATNWKKATPSEKERFVEYFSQHLMDTYLQKIQTATGDYHIRYTSEKVKGRRAVVDSAIVTGTTNIPVTYKLKNSNGKWFSYDVVIEGQSLVNSYRGVYSAVVKQQGMSGLLDNLQQSISDYKQRTGTR